MAQTVKNLPTLQETQIQSLNREDPLENKLATHFHLLAWRFHGQKSQVGCSPRGPKESDTTEQLTLPIRIDILEIIQYFCFCYFEFQKFDFIVTQFKYFISIFHI